MGCESILTVLHEAARRRATVDLSFIGDEGEALVEIEPYSILRRSGVLTLFCWDTVSRRVIALPTEKLTMALPTSRSFTPRFDVEL